MNPRAGFRRALGRLGDRSGQVEVETAIVMPAVIFLLLGLLQLGMLHQARLFTKYAAYRAVRTGAVRNADVDKMEAAAVAAALPILSRSRGGSEVLDKTHTPTLWRNKLIQSGFGGGMAGMGFSNIMTDAPPMPYARVIICGPLQGDVNDTTYEVEGIRYVPFDDPNLAGRPLDTKLRIELLINYRMVIPFADWVIFRMAFGQDLVKELRLQSRENLIGSVPLEYAAAEAQGVHALPIRAQYAMKLHSDVRLEDLPTENNCKAGGGS